MSLASGPVDSPWPELTHNLLVTHEVVPDAPWLMFESHIDTVSIEGMTIEPLAAEVRDGRIWGRGACDTKGTGAAMLWALREYAESGTQGNNVAIVYALDEERLMRGSAALAASQLADFGFRPAGVVVGEPTLHRPVVAHNGLVRWGIRTGGVACHSSDPSRGVSAISTMAAVVQAIEAHYIPQLTAQHPLTGKAQCSINTIHGGSQTNIIPDSCRIELDRRVVPGEDLEQVLPAVEAVLQPLRRRTSGMANRAGNAELHAGPARSARARAVSPLRAGGADGAGSTDRPPGRALRHRRQQSLGGRSGHDRPRPRFHPAGAHQGRVAGPSSSITPASPSTAALCPHAGYDRMSVVIVNIGNTHTTWASGEPGALRIISRHNTSAMTRSAWQPPTMPALDDSVELLGASVVPKAAGRVWQSVNLPIRWLDAPLAEYAGLDLSGVDADTVGADRLANAIAAIHELPLPAMVVDCGTAIASVVVDEKKRFRGGFIPAWPQAAAHGPEAPHRPAPRGAHERQPPLAFGRNTPGCIRAGIDLGTPGALSRLIQAVRQELDAEALSTIAIGGDRDYMAVQVPELDAGPEDFTLRGIAYAGRMI